MAQAVKTKTGKNKSGADELLPQIKTLMLANRRQTEGFQYTVPSPKSYPYQWLWDSCFHSIILSYFDSEAARLELKSLVSKQFKNGMLPHMIYWQKADNHHFPDIRWGKRGTSSITQPPVLAHAVWHLYETTKDIEILEEFYPSVVRFHRYYIRNRDPRNNHLVGLIHPDESGEDNSPRFDRALRLHAKHKFESNYQKRMELVDVYRDVRFKVKDQMDTMHWVRDVPVNAILVNALEIESAMAAVLGQSQASASAQKHAQLMKNSMRKYLLDKQGLMWSTNGQNYRPIKIKTWALFAPLLAGVLTESEAQKLIDKFWDDEQTFASPYRMPTVATDEPSFSSGSPPQQGLPYHLNWRGPVWFASNWIIYKGLKRYGFDSQASKLKRDSRRLIKKSGFREYYDPLTGAGYGAEHFTWGGLLLDMN